MSNYENLIKEIECIVADTLELTDRHPDGTYYHALTRAKSGYTYGTIDLDDFEEIDYGLVDDIMEDIKGVLKVLSKERGRNYDYSEQRM